MGGEGADGGGETGVGGGETGVGHLVVCAAGVDCPEQSAAVASGPVLKVRDQREDRGELFHRELPVPIPRPVVRRTEDSRRATAADALRAIYEGEKGLSSDDDVIVYCRIGERSSHTWFVLTRLLGYERVRNYDGSWTEWGNLVGVPIER